MVSPRRRIIALARGRVQGVGYRAFCADEAVLLGLEGFARNLPDGRVQVIAEGDESRLRQFVARLRTGPPLSRVDDVTFRWEDPTGEYQGFEVMI